MSDAAIVPVERGAAERLAFTCCVKERLRARRRLCRRAAQIKKSADRDASTPGFQNKSTQHQLGAFVLQFGDEHTLPCPAKVLSARVLSARLTVALHHAQHYVIHVPQ